MKRLARKFYTQPTLKVAKQMLGKYLVHKTKQAELIGKIVETEAYIGTEDKASHAYKGKKTERNKAEWLIGGHIYIYLVYGMYWQLNISTGREGRPECVLIRALEPVNGINQMNKNRKLKQKQTNKQYQGSDYDTKTKMTDGINWVNLTNGPGKLCQAMDLNKSHYGIDTATSKEIYLTKGEPVKPSQIVSSKRIGIDYAQEWADKTWRFYIKDNKFVSKY